MSFFKSKLFLSLISGLLPTAILGILIVFGLNRTSEQLQLLQEQTSYVRKPQLIVGFKDFPPLDPNKYINRLYVANVGNESIKNLDFQLKLFLINDSRIYTFGHQFSHIRQKIRDTTLTAREKLWPGISLDANSNEVSIQDMLIREISKGFTGPIDVAVWKKEMTALSKQLEGTYVLFVETVYRRSSDFILEKDTTYIYFQPEHSGPAIYLDNLYGGQKIKERIVNHLREGNIMEIMIREDHYNVQEYRFFSSPIALYHDIPKK